MRIVAVAAWICALGLGCTFSAHPPNGVQACSNDQPPRCPDGYTCASGLCYRNGEEPTTGGSLAGGGGTSGSGGQGGGGQGDAGPCTPIGIDCGKGAGKRCGKIPDGCNGTVECGVCIVGESCQAGRVCSAACGQATQPCCANNTCESTSTACVNNICTPCGGAQQPCCSSNACAGSAASCVEASSVSPPVTTAERICLPACLSVLGACASGTDRDCATKCGPNKVGYQTCTCGTNTWKCSTCSFLSGVDYSCFKLPTTIAACDPSTPPTNGAACTTAPCSPCGSAAGKGYVEAGVTRAGYCVCMNGLWSCAPTKQWPCPAGQGC